MQSSKMYDWTNIARQVDAIERGGNEYAKRAIALILGEDSLRDAVDYYITMAPGAELVKSVLSLLRPHVAMEHCYEIYCSDADIEKKRSAIDLLRMILDSSVLPWASEFLADEDLGIQRWGAGVVDQLLWCEFVDPEACRDLLKSMREHANPDVRETHRWILGFLKKREEQETEQGAATDA